MGAILREGSAILKELGVEGSTTPLSVTCTGTRQATRPVSGSTPAHDGDTRSRKGGGIYIVSQRGKVQVVGVNGQLEAGILLSGGSIIISLISEAGYHHFRPIFFS